MPRAKFLRQAMDGLLDEARFGEPAALLEVIQQKLYLVGIFRVGMEFCGKLGARMFAAR